MRCQFCPEEYVLGMCRPRNGLSRVVGVKLRPYPSFYLSGLGENPTKKANTSKLTPKKIIIPPTQMFSFDVTVFTPILRITVAIIVNRDWSKALQLAR